MIRKCFGIKHISAHVYTHVIHEIEKIQESNTGGGDGFVGWVCGVDCDAGGDDGEYDDARADAEEHKRATA